jgi:ferritin-like metal-binding protein YciE
MAHNELLMGWLNDAYGMEQSITHVLENHAKDAKDQPQLQTRIQEHLDATRRHADLVKTQIERLGGSTSSVKSAMSHVMGTAQGMATGMAKDELLKNALSDYSTEQMEIASYTSLQAAAQELGDQQLAAACQSILQDEERMARFLFEHIPMMTRQMLTMAMQEHAGQTGAMAQDTAPPA